VTWPGKLEPLSPPPSTHGVVKAEEAEDDTEELLRHYLSLKLDLGSLYEQWSLADPNFKRRAPKFEGVRILSQDAWETLISFICSSNNNIARISQMVRSPHAPGRKNTVLIDGRSISSAYITGR
jgi:N-glycosylase/DNA lyase